LNGRGELGRGEVGSVDFALLLRLEHSIADIVADMATGGLAYGELLEAIGTSLQWPLGSAWLVPTSTTTRQPAELHCAATWCAATFDGEEFAAVTRDLVLRPGEGLPGRVWRSGHPTWVRDISTRTEFPRAAAAARAGLAAAFCFPLVSQDGIEGFLEFFAPNALEPASELLATTTSLGRRIGDALRRGRVDEAVRRSEARLRAVLDAALDCVVIADADGVVLEFNPAACATFGYAREQAIGRALVDIIVPPGLRGRHEAGLRRYLETEEPRVLDRRIEIQGMRADGTSFPVELTITRIALPGRPVFAGYLRDLSERYRSEAELRESRRRVVEAAVAERQRLERDLHDGAQQRLISLGTALARARTALPAEPVRAAEILDEAIRALDEAAVELRNLARGIHPSSLTRYGLRAALKDVARRSPVDLHLGTVPRRRFPPSVESTAYFVISEALTNVARHAGTGHARVDLGLDAATLVVTVADDGPGGASADRGSGLRGLADRVALLDGSLEVLSPAGSGTTLRARIPVPAG
jgi:PAS domain S-box-containing protein